jgi:hypothetical protein
VTVTLSAEQVNVLEALAQARQSSLSALVRQVIAHGLAVDPHGGEAMRIEVDGVPVPAWLVSTEPLAAIPRPEKVSRGNQ